MDPAARLAGPRLAGVPRQQLAVTRQAGHSRIGRDQLAGLPQGCKLLLRQSGGRAEIVQGGTFRMTSEGAVQLLLHLAHGQASHHHVVAAALQATQFSQIRQELLRNHQMFIQIMQ
jgi:hypothetical protein